MVPPKWWENLAVCDECEAMLLKEEFQHLEADEAQRDSPPPLRGD